MKLQDLVSEKTISPQLQSQSRDEVITELIDALITSGAAPKKLRDDLIAKVLEREKKGSTGFGRGVAVPHVKHPDVKTISAAIGLSAEGIEFNSLDKLPVHSVFLLLSPEGSPEDHLQAMEVIFRRLSNETFRRFLRQSTTVEDVLSLLADADNQQLAG